MTNSSGMLLHVEGIHLVDADGCRVRLRGVSTHGLSWYPQYVNREAFTQLRDEWGVNAVRLAMYTAESGGYLTDGDPAALEALVDKGAALCEALGLYYIIDWHILSDNNPLDHAEEAGRFFARMSERHGNRAIYEICNEPNGAEVTWPVVKAYAEKVIPVIRAHAPEALILCGTPTWSQDVDRVAADPLTDSNLMYTLHFYAATHKEALRDKARAALNAGTPVFVSEFSICDASGNGALDYASADAWSALIDEYGLSYMMWNLANRDESSCLLRADCDKTSGWTDADLNDTGRWLKARLSGAKNPS